MFPKLFFGIFPYFCGKMISAILSDKPLRKGNKENERRRLEVGCMPQSAPPNIGPAWQRCHHSRLLLPNASQAHAYG